MSSPVPFVDVCGFPAPGDPVEPTPRAAAHLVAAGWTPPPPPPWKSDKPLTGFGINGGIAA